MHGGESRTYLCMYKSSSGLSCIRPQLSISCSRSGNCRWLCWSLTQLQAAPMCPGCRSRGWGVSNAIILPLF